MHHTIAVEEGVGPVELRIGVSDNVAKVIHRCAVAERTAHDIAARVDGASAASGRSGQRPEVKHRAPTVKKCVVLTLGRRRSPYNLARAVDGRGGTRAKAGMVWVQRYSQDAEVGHRPIF